MNDSKEHILITSLNLFLQKSFKEVTMKEIVDKTGLSKGAFYHYFNSKEQVFEEVIAHFYSDIIITDYSKFSQTSLLDFCTSYLNDKRLKFLSSKIANTNKDKAFTANHYFLIFDAMKLLPDFKAQRTQQQKDELKAWIKVIRKAKTNKEIKSKIKDEQLAKLFIYSAKGAGINCIMADKYDDARKEIKALWDGLYSELKR
jgi:TetR/AcrR family transcriptional repressor of nem operon